MPLYCMQRFCCCSMQPAFWASLAPITAITMGRPETSRVNKGWSESGVPRARTLRSSVVFESTMIGTSAIDARFPAT
jgi:hypothetical protein